MIKFIGIFLVLLVAYSSVHGAKLPDTQTPPLNSASSVNWSLIFSGIQAFGTLLVAVLAIFGQRIRSWFIRPRLRITVGDKPPYAESKEQRNESTVQAQIIYQLRLEILNNGREAARNCSVLCSKILREKAGGQGFYTIKEFVPLQFYWTTKNQTADIVPKLPSIINVAELSISDASVSSSEEVKVPSPGFNLQVQVEAEGIKGQFFRVEKGKIIVPIIVHADNLPRSMKKYLELCWRGDSEKDFTPEKFQIRVIDETEGLRLVGGV